MEPPAQNSSHLKDEEEKLFQGLEKRLSDQKVDQEEKKLLQTENLLGDEDDPFDKAADLGCLKSPESNLLADEGSELDLLKKEEPLVTDEDLLLYSFNEKDMITPK